MCGFLLVFFGCLFVLFCGGFLLDFIYRFSISFPYSTSYGVICSVRLEVVGFVFISFYLFIVGGGGGDVCLFVWVFYSFFSFFLFPPSFVVFCFVLDTDIV